MFVVGVEASDFLNESLDLSDRPFALDVFVAIDDFLKLLVSKADASLGAISGGIFLSLRSFFTSCVIFFPCEKRAALSLALIGLGGS